MPLIATDCRPSLESAGRLGRTGRPTRGRPPRPRSLASARPRSRPHRLDSCGSRIVAGGEAATVGSWSELAVRSEVHAGRSACVRIGRTVRRAGSASRGSQGKGIERCATRRGSIITTAIDYPNSRPHIGTAFEKIGADVQARFRRMEGHAVHFLMGNDENTIKVSQRAEELGVEPKPYVDDMARQFQEVWTGPGDLHTTTSSRPARSATTSAAASSSRRSTTRATSTRRRTPGLYCNGCEAFKTEKELVDGRCPNHPNLPLRQVEEENYFFRLSAFGDRLLAHYEANPDFIQPESRRNEIVNLVKSGLQDVAITRKGSPGASRSRSTPSRRSTSGSTPC